MLSFVSYPDRRDRLSGALHCSRREPVACFTLLNLGTLPTSYVMVSRVWFSETEDFLIPLGGMRDSLVVVSTKISWTLE